MRTNSDSANTESLADMFEEATRNAQRTNALAVASGHVVVKRVSLGMAAAMNPLAADHVEFARMIPEKVGAFSAASLIMLKQAGNATRQMTRLASSEVLTAARASVTLADCHDLAALARAQRSLVCSWYNRATMNFIKIGMLALCAQDAVMDPLRQTVAINIERLAS